MFLVVFEHDEVLTDLALDWFVSALLDMLLHVFFLKHISTVFTGYLDVQFIMLFFFVFIVEFAALFTLDHVSSTVDLMQ